MKRGTVIDLITTDKELPLQKEIRWWEFTVVVSQKKKPNRSHNKKPNLLFSFLVLY